jgi:hypothetical protein
MKGGEVMLLWCCQCQTDVEARLTSGAECYPHRRDLADIPRWKCDGCGNHVGTHHKTSEPTKPLGNIPSPEMKRARIAIHGLIDPAWQAGIVGRGRIYAHLGTIVGRKYHTAELRSVDEARTVFAAARDFIRQQSRNASATADSPKGVNSNEGPEWNGNGN